MYTPERMRTIPPKVSNTRRYESRPRRFSSQPMLTAPMAIGMARPCPYQILDPAIFMMQSAEDRPCDDLAEQLDRPLTG